MRTIKPRAARAVRAATHGTDPMGAPRGIDEGRWHGVALIGVAIRSEGRE